MDSKKPNSKRETHSTDQLLLPQPQTTWAPSKSIKEVAPRGQFRYIKQADVTPRTFSLDLISQHHGNKMETDESTVRDSTREAVDISNLLIK
jgi:hypothetical protein